MSNIGEWEEDQAKNEFTDDDLKRLKEDMRPQTPWDYVRFDPDKITALIARLEAAEDVIYYRGHDAPMDAWRKAAGKS